MTTRVSTARWTGVFYLGLALAGLVGFLFVRSELYVADDATAILANLVDPVPLARFGIAADLTVVLAQALAAIWFSTSSAATAASLQDRSPPLGWSTPQRSW